MAHSLARAKRVKNDEYYTQLVTVEQQFSPHLDFLKGKRVYCNCDSAESAFVRYFQREGIDCVHSADDYALPKNQERLAEADLVATNPPFSQIIPYTNALLALQKDFIIIAPQLAVTNHNVANRFVSGELFFATGMRRTSTQFDTPDGPVSMGGMRWWTNIEAFRPVNPPLQLAEQDLDGYARYANLPGAIHVPKIKKIPTNHNGLMGVPLSYLDHHCPEQFELVRSSYGDDGKLLRFVDGRVPYRRLIVSGKT